MAKFSCFIGSNKVLNTSMNTTTERNQKPNLDSLSDNVHIWLISFKKLVSDYHDFYAMLSPDEIERAHQFRFAKDRNAFVITRGALRKLISHYLSIQAIDISFRYTEYDKPVLRTPENNTIQFNVSHSGDYGLIAISRCSPLGIDIEEMKTDLDLMEMAQQVFSGSEYQQLIQLPEAKRIQAFYNGWTRKEAYIKGDGKGLSIPLKSFNVSLVDKEQPILLATAHDEQACDHWSIYNINTPENYAGALAIKSKKCQIKLFIYQ
ncbi:4'-phosphopantetheinyl transferase family protein [Marinicella sp. W31]|uniref:4'-phosphopantetheinyl transferase family protein n=1 Tax=Marinicella sp. W31 TaxID=3023713 RepID=UPI00375664DF